MKKIKLACIAAMCAVLPVSASEDVLSAETSARWADNLVGSLIQNFWGASFAETPDRYYFNKKSRQADMGTGDYWPQAHAIDVVTDAYVRTKDEKYYRLYDLWWQGMPRFNFDAWKGRRFHDDPWWNAFVDDMEWHCLALIRIYEATQETRYLNKARQIYGDWIWSQWSPENEEPWHGGITWKTDVRRSKNACSNGPAAIIAARLSKFAEVDAGYEKNKPKETYLDEALRIYRWERQYLWNAQNGAIYDNMNQDGRLGRFSLSYNQGTFIGAAVELYQLTGDASLLDDAVLTARYTTGPMSERNGGVLPDATDGDGGLFHGIFFRYLANLIVLPELDNGVRRELADYMQHSAEVMMTQGVNPQTNIYGGRWREQQPAEIPSALTPQLTACMLMEAVCKINSRLSGGTLHTHDEGAPLRLAVAGVTHGHLGEVVRRMNRGDFQIVGVAEPREEYRNQNDLTGRIPQSLFYEDLAKMLDETKPEVVVAYGSIYDHLSVVEACAPRGIHVMVEKPLAVSYKDAARMAKLAEKHGIKLLTNYETTWYSTNQYAHRLIGEGQIGTPLRINIYDGHEGPKEIGCGARFLEWLTDPVLNGGGAVVDFGCYGANLATWLLDGQTPKSVYAVLKQHKPETYPKVDDDATIVVEYPDCTVQIMASWCWPKGRKDMYVYGSNGSIFQLTPTQMETRIGRHDSGMFEAPALEPPYNDSFRFLKAVVRGEITLPPYDLSSLENNLMVVRILDAARRSAKTGRPVKP